MKKVCFLFLVSWTAASFAAPMNCKFYKKDPVGTKTEQEFKGFTYEISPDKETLVLSNLEITKDAKNYSADGKAWPNADSGTLNPSFAENKRIAERHKGYQQYKNFKLIKSNVLWSRFEVLVDDAGHARVPITTNDGVWTEELFDCEAAK